MAHHLSSASGRFDAIRTAIRGFVAVAVCVSSVACAANGPPVAQAPPIDAGQLAARATSRSALDGPYRLRFEWEAIEAGTRLSGRGVARVEDPLNARLDLFASNGEHIAAAAVVGDEPRIAAGQQTEIPPPALLWGTLGIFRPGLGVGLAGGRWHGNGVAELRYLPPEGGEIVYTLEDDRIQMIDVVDAAGRRLQEVRIESASGERFPRQATYRNLQTVQELRITLESVEHVETYPIDVWDPR